MKNHNENKNNPDHALITAVTSAFRSINPSYTKAQTWYAQINPSKVIPSPVKVRSKYYVPLFGSVLASAFALIMILTSPNTTIPNQSIAFNNTAETTENTAPTTFEATSARSIPAPTESKQVLAKIDAQTKAASRTQADESFTESLNTETSLQDLFQ